MSERTCPVCKHKDYDKGRAADGRRSYRCKRCGEIWTEGMQGREKKFITQNGGYQFHDTKEPQ